MYWNLFPDLMEILGFTEDNKVKVAISGVLNSLFDQEDPLERGVISLIRRNKELCYRDNNGMKSYPQINPLSFIIIDNKIIKCNNVKV